VGSGKGANSDSCTSSSKGIVYGAKDIGRKRGALDVDTPVENR